MTLRDKISNIITNELYERYASPSAAIVAVQITDKILALLDEEARDQNIERDLADRA